MGQEVTTYLKIIIPIVIFMFLQAFVLGYIFQDSLISGDAPSQFNRSSSSDNFDVNVNSTEYSDSDAPQLSIWSILYSFDADYTGFPEGIRTILSFINWIVSLIAVITALLFAKEFIPFLN